MLVTTGNAYSTCNHKVVNLRPEVESRASKLSACRGGVPLKEVIFLEVRERMKKLLTKMYKMPSVPIANDGRTRR